MEQLRRILAGSDTAKSFTIDSYGRQRVASPVTLFANKNIHNRNKNLWEEPIVGAIIAHGAVTGGPFVVSETITGSISGTVGTITVVDSGAVTYTVNHDDFEVGETITGGTSGATAIISTVGIGSTIFHDRDNGAVILQVGQNNGDSAVRISHIYTSYVPGTGHAIFETFLLGAAVENVECTVGYGNFENGLFLNQTLSGRRFIRRTKASGSVVDVPTEQADWNVDKFDGFGPSGKTLDPTKSSFLFIDYAWQGAGPIRMGLFVDGIPFTAHEFRFFDVLDTVFMSTPSLPVFYEIKNTGDTVSTNVLKEFCTAVMSEGGEELTGVGFSVSVETTPRSITTNEPILAIRLKNTFGGGPNRKTIRLSNAGAFATDNGIHFDIIHLHDPTDIAATWNDVGGGSAVEFSTDITVVTGNPSHKIDEGYAAAGQAGKGGAPNVVTSNVLDQHRVLTQNIDSTNSEIFLVRGASLVPQIAKVYPNMSWIEFD
ncbi:hypothetical protein KAR91_31955 [Candidatus Pacearchaeota archaeon]|nr:hypothetical protein [Candidatus Pacearchaeota archaeon]